MTPQTAGVAACTACISRAGVPCSRNADEQERRVDDVEVERVQRLAGARRSSARDRSRRARRSSHVRSGECSSQAPGVIGRAGCRWLARSRSCRDRCRDRAPSSPARAGGVASHITAVTTTISTTTETKLCQRKIVWRKGMMPPGTMPPCGDDVADLRLQGAGRGHLQRRRSAEPLRPDAAEAEEARGRQRAVVDALDAPRHLAREHGAEDQAEAPVEPRARRARRSVTSATAPRGVVGQPAIARISRRIGARGRQHVAGDDHQRHLQRERNQSQKPRPQASTTCSEDDGVADERRRRRRGRSRAARR